MAHIIDKLIRYAQIHLDLPLDDIIYVRNRILELLKIDAHENTAVDDAQIKPLAVPDVLLGELKELIEKNQIVPPAEVERLVGAIIGTLTPLPSAVNARFWNLYRVNPHQATDYLYNLQVKNDYIKKTFVDTNIHWLAPFHDNFLEITINMSKPEKRNEDIAKLVKATPTGYPKCVLCADNIGYYGRDDHPNRTNIRVANLTLNGKPWFFQYSPYVYYDRHCIVIDYDHHPMAVDRDGVVALLDFVTQFPHFFIGSNSDLPLVGGSILNHEHFQGGAHLMPLMHSRPAYEVKLPTSEVSCHGLNWYNTAFLFKSANREKLTDEVTRMVELWRGYSDEACDILAATDARHNTATILARIEEGAYLVYVILRNNRRSKRYPEGIFHAHPEYFHIKSEGIGLIEASGLFILPARLKRQLTLIEEGLKDGYTPARIIEKNPDLAIHETMITDIHKNLGDDIRKQITTYVNGTCRSILDNTAVYKSDDKGRAGLSRFIKAYTS